MISELKKKLLKDNYNKNGNIFYMIQIEII